MRNFKTRSQDGMARSTGLQSIFLSQAIRSHLRQMCDAARLLDFNVFEFVLRDFFDLQSVFAMGDGMGCGRKDV